MYLEFIGTEEVEVRDVDMEYDMDGDTQRRVETVRASERTVNLEMTVAGAQELAANSEFEWQVEVSLPSHAPAIFRGKYCQHGYYARAGLDCFGNDPDSGWVEIAE